MRVISILTLLLQLCTYVNAQHSNLKINGSTILKLNGKTYQAEDNQIIIVGADTAGVILSRDSGAKRKDNAIITIYHIFSCIKDTQCKRFNTIFVLFADSLEERKFKAEKAQELKSLSPDSLYSSGHRTSQTGIFSFFVQYPDSASGAELEKVEEGELTLTKVDKIGRLLSGTVTLKGGMNDRTLVDLEDIFTDISY